MPITMSSFTQVNFLVYLFVIYENEYWQEMGTSCVYTRIQNLEWDNFEFMRGILIKPVKRIRDILTPHKTREGSEMIDERQACYKYFSRDEDECCRLDS